MSEFPARRRSFWGDALVRFSKNRLALFGSLLIVSLIIIAIFAPFVAPQAYDKAHFDEAWQFPSRQHLMGTDELGRDFFSRIVYGARTSLFVGIVSQVISAMFGVSLGVIAGFRGGKLNYLVMFLADALWAVPRLLLALLIMVLLGGSLRNILFVIALTGWIPVCRVARAEVMKQREQEYVIAALATGASEIRILIRHLLPNILVPVIVTLTLGIPDAIFTEAGLSFLGVGIPPPLPSWGQMVGRSLSYIRYYWHLALFPSVMLAVTMLSFALLGDALRDVLDVRMTM